MSSKRDEDIVWTVKDSFGWLFAYFKLEDRHETVWKAVFRNMMRFWFSLLLVATVATLGWQIIFKILVVLLTRMGYPKIAWFFD